jgi:hypothetical protein
MVVGGIEPIFEPIFLHVAKLSFANLKKVLILNRDILLIQNSKIKSKK